MMKEYLIELIKAAFLIIIIIFCVSKLIDNKNDKIEQKLNTIETNSRKIDSILIMVDSVKSQRTNIVNNIDKRMTVINNLKEEKKKPYIKDTSITNAVNFLNDFSKNELQ